MSILTIDGQPLEYQRHGAEGGTPVLLHHGLVGSASIGDEWRRLSVNAGVEVIAVARPGYGGSAPRQMASIGGWSQIVESLLDAVGLDRVGVLGVSAGAPYSYALAALLSERVTRVAIASGLGLVNEPDTVACYPAESQAAFESFAQSGFEDVRAFWHHSLTQALDQYPEGHPWRAAVQESLAHDGAGPAREAILQQRPWGFDPRSILTPVSLWHSRADDDVPFATAQIVAERIPGAVLTEQPEPGHLPSASTVKAALTFLS